MGKHVVTSDPTAWAGALDQRKVDALVCPYLPGNRGGPHLLLRLDGRLRLGRRRWERYAGGLAGLLGIRQLLGLYGTAQVVGNLLVGTAYDRDGLPDRHGGALLYQDLAKYA